jgi:VanZ family protein
MHFLLIGGIAFWIVGGWRDPRLSLGRLRLPLAVAVPLLVAGAEEALQLLSPRRNADLADFAADAAGLLVFWLLGRRLLSGGLLEEPAVGEPEKS